MYFVYFYSNILNPQANHPLSYQQYINIIKHMFLNLILSTKSTRLIKNHCITSSVTFQNTKQLSSSSFGKLVLRMFFINLPIPYLLNYSHFSINLTSYATFVKYLHDIPYYGLSRPWTYQ